MNRILLLATLALFSVGGNVKAQGILLIYTCTGPQGGCYKVGVGLAGTTWSSGIGLYGTFYRSQTSTWSRSSSTQLTSRGCTSVTITSQAGQVTDTTPMSLGDGLKAASDGTEAGVRLIAWTRIRYLNSIDSFTFPSVSNAVPCT